MSNHTAKFVAAIIGSILAGTNFVAVAENAAQTADTCLSGPKGALPAGGHWYYRIDRAKRQCWYIGDEKEKLAKVASPQPSSAATAAPAPSEQAIQRSVADAHAELPLPRPRPELDTVVVNAQRSPAAAANAAGPEISQRTDTQPNPPPSTMPSRWPETPGMASSADPTPRTDNSPPALPSKSKPAPAAPASAVPLAAADASTNQASALQMLLIVIVGALAVAGLMGSAIFRFGSTRRIGRRPIWESTDTELPLGSSYQSAPIWGSDRPRELPVADDPNERIARMLAQLARSGAR